MIDEKKLIARFFRYAEISSESGSEEEICACLMNDLAQMGLSPVIDTVGQKIGSTGGNIYCNVPGKLSGEPLLLSAHVDTVKPGKNVQPLLGDHYITTSGSSVLGGDDKSGIAVILEALDTVRTKGLPHRPLELLFTVSEEIGQKGSLNFDYRQLQSRQALVMDSQGGFGDVKLFAPGKNKLTFEITGRAAHAGAAPEAGISAISVAAEAISHMRLLRIDEETTANIGSFLAEGSTNIVPAYARMEAEVRSMSLEKLAAQCTHMQSCVQAAAEKFGASFRCEVQEGARPYRVPEDHPLVQRIVTLCRSAAIPVHLFGDGGASDANSFAYHGIAAVALGCGMDKVHTPQETLERSLFLQAANALAALITTI